MSRTVSSRVGIPLRIAALVASLLTAVACSRTPPPTFVAVSDGVVRDQRSDLEWTAHDREHALAWKDAERECRALALGGHDDWRLPGLAEVESLYDVKRDAPCSDRRCRLDPAITLGGPYVWTTTERGEGTRIYFDFSAGTSFSPNIRPTLVRRTLCVRGPVAR